jgi:predicted ATPase
LFLISGEPGICKTRLAEQLSSQASERSVRVLWGRCWEGGGAPAYWPIVQILRGCGERPDFAQSAEILGDGIRYVASLVPELVRRAAREQGAGAEGGDPEQARFLLFDAVARLIKGLADREPMVLVIDDLHDAGAAALQMLSFLARALKDAPVLLIGTHREAEVERSPELRSAIAQLARAGSQLPLGGLNQADVVDLALRHAGLSFR